MRIGLFDYKLQNYNQPKKTKNINFEGHKLVKVLKDPSYEGLLNYVYKLTNGQTVVVIPKKGPGALTVSTVVKTGAFNEHARQRGISHFMEHLAFDGSKKGVFRKGLRPNDFARKVTLAGAELNAGTLTDFTSYYFSVAAVNLSEFAKLLKAHATMIKYPSLPKKQFLKEKGVVIQEIKQDLDDPLNTVSNKLISTLHGVKLNVSDFILGSAASINKMTRKEVLAYHKASYTPDRMETFIVGDIDPEKAVVLVDKYFDTPDFRPSTSPLFSQKLNNIQATKMVFLSNSNVANSTIVIGFVGPNIMDRKASVAADAMLEIISGNKGLRLGKKLAPLDTDAEVNILSVSNDISTNVMLSFDINVQPGDEQKALNAFKRTIAELKKSPITQEELDLAKIKMLDEINMGSETSSDIVNTLENFSPIGGISGYTNRIRNVKELTLADINSILSHLDIDKAGVVILQPKKSKNTNIHFNGRNIIDKKRITDTILPNGIRLVINDDITKIRTALSVMIEGVPKSKTGVAEVLVTMLSNATSIHSESELDMYKARQALNDVHVQTVQKGIVVNITSMKESLLSGLNLTKEMLFSPKLTRSAFEKAKRKVLIDAQDVPLNSVDRGVEVMYGEHYLGQSERKLRAELKKVSFEDIQEYYKSLFANPRATVFITAPMSKIGGVKAKIAKELSSIDATFCPLNIADTEPITPKANKVVLQVQNERTQTGIVQYFHIHPENIEDDAALDVLDNILGSGMSSRLFNDLREKQELAYYVKSVYSRLGTWAQLKLLIQTSIEKDGKATDNIRASILGFEKHLQKLMRTLVTDEELLIAKRGLINQYVTNSAKANEQNLRLKKSINSPESFDYYNRLLCAIESVTTEDIKRVARKYLDRSSVISILTTKDAAKNAEPFLKTIGDYKRYNTEVEKT